MAIEITTGFKQLSSEPLDSRTNVSSIAERDAIPQVQRYYGLMVFVQDVNEIYTLQSDLVTWIAGVGGGSSSAPILQGSRFPTLLENPPTATPQLYIDFGGVLTDGRGVLWGHVQSNWYPLSCCHSVKHNFEDLIVAEEIQKIVNKNYQENLELTETISFGVRLDINDPLDLVEGLNKSVSKTIADSLKIRETININFVNQGATINGSSINSGGIN